MHRLAGLLQPARPGAQGTIDDAHVDAVIANTLESVPVGATHWTKRTMAREMELSQTAATRIWRAFGLQPHRQEPFKLSSDPMFVDKVRDIVGPYMDPSLKTMVLCTDEKSHAIRQYLDIYNANPHPLSWSKSADEFWPILNGFVCGLGRPWAMDHEHQHQHN